MRGELFNNCAWLNHSSQSTPCRPPLFRCCPRRNLLPSSEPSMIVLGRKAAKIEATKLTSKTDLRVLLECTYCVNLTPGYELHSWLFRSTTFFLCTYQGAHKIQALARPVWRCQEEEKDRMALITSEEVKKCNTIRIERSFGVCTSTYYKLHHIGTGLFMPLFVTRRNSSWSCLCCT